MRSDYSAGLRWLLAAVGTGALEFLLFTKKKFKAHTLKQKRNLTISTGTGATTGGRGHTTPNEHHIHTPLSQTFLLS